MCDQKDEFPATADTRILIRQSTSGEDRSKNQSPSQSISSVVSDTYKSPTDIVVNCSRFRPQFAISTRIRSSIAHRKFLVHSYQQLKVVPAAIALLRDVINTPLFFICGLICFCLIKSLRTFENIFFINLIQTAHLSKYVVTQVTALLFGTVRVLKTRLRTTGKLVILGERDEIIYYLVFLSLRTCRKKVCRRVTGSTCRKPSG